MNFYYFKSSNSKDARSGSFYTADEDGIDYTEQIEGAVVDTLVGYLTALSASRLYSVG